MWGFMNNLYKENVMKINNEIAKEQSNYVKYGKFVDYCNVAFKGLALGHIIITGIYALGMIVPAMLSMSALPFATPVVCGLVASCAISLITTSVLERVFEKKQEKASLRFDSLVNMKRKYEEKPISHKEGKNNMRCKNIIYDYNYSKDMSLSLKK